MRAHEIPTGMPYLLLLDYGGCEGWAMVDAFLTPEQALSAYREHWHTTGQPFEVVRRVHFQASEEGALIPEEQGVRLPSQGRRIRPWGV